MSKTGKPGRVSVLARLPVVRRFARQPDGAAAIEFALIALPFLAIIFASIQTAIVLIAEQELETATEQAGRLVMTGQVTSAAGQSGTLTQSQFSAKVCSYLVALFNCSNLMVNVQTAGSFANANVAAPSYQTLQNNTWNYNTGTAGQIVVMQVMYEWPIFGSLLGYNLSNLPNGTRLLMATAAFQNEP